MGENIRKAAKGGIRTATWNILNRADDYEERLPGIAAALADRGVDVASLQEVRVDGREPLESALADRGYGLAMLTGSRERPVRGTNMEPVSEDTVAVTWRSDGPLRPYGGISVKQHGSMQAMSMDFMINEKSLLTMASYHGMWGCNRQMMRMREVSELVSGLPEESDSHAVIIGGDFNAEPGERAIRYMMGEEPGVGGDDWTFWLDAQNVMASLGRGRAKFTTICHGKGADTNRLQGIDPMLMPERIIDHIMTRGYRYGRAGGFTAVSVSNTGSVLSDHRLLTADIAVY